MALKAALVFHTEYSYRRQKGMLFCLKVVDMPSFSKMTDHGQFIPRLFTPVPNFPLICAFPVYLSPQHSHLILTQLRQMTVMIMY